MWITTSNFSYFYMMAVEWNTTVLDFKQEMSVFAASTIGFEGGAKEAESNPVKPTARVRWHTRSIRFRVRKQGNKVRPEQLTNQLSMDMANTSTLGLVLGKGRRPEFSQGSQRSGRLLLHMGCHKGSNGTRMIGLVCGLTSCPQKSCWGLDSQPTTGPQCHVYGSTTRRHPRQETGKN